MRTRCKFHVVGVENTEYFAAFDETDPKRPGIPGKYCQNVRLVAQYDSNKSEDVSFAAATPSGELKIFVSNPAVVGTFIPGTDYYLDLIPVE